MHFHLPKPMHGWREFAGEVARAENYALKFEKDAILRVLDKGGLGIDFPQLDPRNPPVIGKGTSQICEPIGKPRETY